MGALEGWEQRLLAVVEDWRGVPFDWGARDCLGFCIACRQAVTGKPWNLPRYATEGGAARQLRKRGFATLEDYVSAHLDQVPVAAARRGDWVMRAGLPGLVPGALGVVVGRQAAFMSEGGLVFLPTVQALRAWRGW